MQKESKRCDQWAESCLNTIKKGCPCCYNLLFSRKSEYKPLKVIFGFLYGLLLGLGFYELIIVDLNFTENAAFIVGGIICLMLGLGIAFSSQIRCIALLAIPAFSGKAGRGVLKALVLAYVISGPIGNLTNNGKEVVRVFACTTTLTFNLTKARFELMFKPFTQALFGMKADVTEVKDTIRSIKDISAPIAGELEGEAEMRKLKEENDYLDSVLNDTKRSKEIDEKYRSKGEEIEAQKYEKQYLKKIEMRCENELSKAGRHCREMFAKAYDNCYDKVTWAVAWLLCWPMKLDFVCNIAQALGGSTRCDPSKDIDPGFGEGYAQLKETRQSLTQNFKDVKVQYKMTKIKQLVDLREASDTAKAVLHEVNSRKALLDSFLVILKRLLAFIFLRIILNAQHYHDHFLRDIQFDNIYITKYFRKIDARRRVQEKHTLLPLKKIERQKLADPCSAKPLKSEREQIVGSTIRLLFEMITATMFILLDRLFYEALDLVKRHARIDYVQTGHHDLVIEVKGTGMIAALLRSVVKGFNIKKRMKRVRSNKVCLPHPSLLSKYYLFKIYGTYLMIWLLMWAQAYTQRLRRLICAYFYRKREKKRVLYLYNETLKRRIGFFRHMKRKVKKMVREHRLQEGLNVLSVLRIRYPRAFGWLRFFAMARRKCVICEEPEPRNKSGIPGDFEKCATPTCYFVHCAECWHDVGMQCMACAESDGEDSGMSDSEGG